MNTEEQIIQEINRLRGIRDQIKKEIIKTQIKLFFKTQQKWI